MLLGFSAGTLILIEEANIYKFSEIKYVGEYWNWIILGFFGLLVIIWIIIRTCWYCEKKKSTETQEERRLMQRRERNDQRRWYGFTNPFAREEEMDDAIVMRTIQPTDVTISEFVISNPKTRLEEEKESKESRMRTLMRKKKRKESKALSKPPPYNEHFYPDLSLYQDEKEILQEKN